MENYCAGGLLEKERTKFTRFQRVVSLVRSPSPPVILPRPFVIRNTQYCVAYTPPGDENVCGVIRPVFDLILRPTPAQKRGCWPAAIAPKRVVAPAS
jgi:hypothetical protein